MLRGEKGIVAPRTLIPEEVKDCDIWQRRRLSMNPGLISAWVIKPDRNDIDFEQWMHMDLEHIYNWSLLLDLKSFLKATQTVLAGGGG